MIEGIYMQLIAILAALVWSKLQLFCLFIATQCVFGIVDLGTPKPTLYQKILLQAVSVTFYSLFILPFISLGLFYFATINIGTWHEFKPAVWVFAAWCGVVFAFLVLITMTESSVRASKIKKSEKLKIDE